MKPEARSQKPDVGSRMSEAGCRKPDVRNPSSVFCPPASERAFTLVEMLVVLSILGILAALVVPALKNVSHSNSMTSATRQLLDDVARARQLAISQHTTVYMVFVPMNFWVDASGNFPNAWWTSLTTPQQTVATNLCDKQLTGYTFIANGAMGDQPGQHKWHYLAPWQTLPDGTFIVTNKFSLPGTTVSSATAPAGFNQWDQDYPHSDNNTIYAFTDVIIPFPTDTSPTNALPCIAFNYLGQLTTEQLTPQSLQRDEYIPLALGNVSPWIDTVTKAYQFHSPQISEIPPGNSTNAYNIIDVEPLTGRATLQQPRVQ